MLIRRRLAMLSELAEQESLRVTVEQVESAHNKADRLTRVPKKWLSTGEPPVVGPGDATGFAASAAIVEAGDEA